MPTTPAPLDEIVALARPIVERVVWCTVATNSPGAEPRTRLMHPVWWWDGAAPVALVSARRTPVKVRDLAANPSVSCFYWDPAHDTVAIDATAAWLDRDARRRAWDAVKAIEPPVGFDPAIIWPAGPDDDGCAFLRFTAHRIVATAAGRPGLRWRAGQT
jgi:hypothetical protein